MIMAFAATAGSAAMSAGSTAMSAMGSAGSSIASGFGSMMGAGGGSAAAAGAGGGGSFLSQAAGMAGGGGSALGQIGAGMNAVSALSSYAMQSQNAGAMQSSAFDERLQATQEFIQAQQRANQIHAEFNRAVGAQMTTAAANGIDVASGSVLEARRSAQEQADQALSISRSTAEMNAALRMARARMLAQSANTTQAAGGASLAMNLLKAGASFMQAA